MYCLFIYVNLFEREQNSFYFYCYGIVQITAMTFVMCVCFRKSREAEEGLTPYFQLLHKIIYVITIHVTSTGRSLRRVNTCYLGKCRSRAYDITPKRALQRVHLTMHNQELYYHM